MNNPSSAGYARYAREFMEAALAADDKIGNKAGHEIIAPVSVMYMVGHSIELILKAYLISKDIKENRLRNIGHDLEKCYKRAKELGLHHHIELSDDDIEVLKVLNVLYKSKQLNYLVTGSKVFPMFGPLETLSNKLLNTIAPLVGYK